MRKTLSLKREQYKTKPKNETAKGVSLDVASEPSGVKAPVPPSGNYNNNSLDDNLRADMKPAVNSLLLGAAWKILEASDPG